jgi:hypothetical protein
VSLSAEVDPQLPRRHESFPQTSSIVTTGTVTNYSVTSPTIRGNYVIANKYLRHLYNVFYRVSEPNSGNQESKPSNFPGSAAGLMQQERYQAFLVQSLKTVSAGQ